MYYSDTNEARTARNFIFNESRNIKDLTNEEINKNEKVDCPNIFDSKNVCDDIYENERRAPAVVENIGGVRDLGVNSLSSPLIVWSQV